MTVGEIIKDYRAKYNITMDDFAQMSGLSKGYISILESGKNPRTGEPIVPSLKTIDGCAAAMGLDFNTLLKAIDPDTMVSLADDETAPLPSNILPLPKTRKVPLLGTIACGEPILASENIAAYLDVAEDIHCDFALRCKGDSMMDARILDGDVVYIRHQPDVENGEIAAVLIDGMETEATLKRVYKSEGQLMLTPANAAYAPRVFIGEDIARVRILGKAVAFASLVR